MRILIAVPTFENIYPATFKSLWDLDRGGHEVLFEAVTGYDCAAARNRIADRAIELNTDYVLMVDSDMVLPKDALLKLLQNQCDVCLGYCLRRYSKTRKGSTCIYKAGKAFNGNDYNEEELAELAKNGQCKLQVHGGGFACALIKTSVFKKLKYPWFNWVIYENKAVLSEDLYFCHECGKANIPIYVDLRVKCGHIMRITDYPI